MINTVRTGKAIFKAKSSLSPKTKHILKKKDSNSKMDSFPNVNLRLKLFVI